MRDRRWWTRTLTAATGVAAVTTVAAGVALGASSSAQDLVPTTTEAVAASAALGSEDGEKPEADPRLTAAREEARDLEGKERREAMKKIRDDVGAGEYGEQAQQRQEKRAERVEKLRRGLPAELRTDLAALKKAPQEEREARREAIRDKALAGDYGPGVRRVLRTVG